MAINAQPLEKVKLAQSQTINGKQPAICLCRDDYVIMGKTVAISITSIGYDGRSHSIKQRSWWRA